MRSHLTFFWLIAVIFPVFAQQSQDGDTLKENNSHTWFINQEQNKTNPKDTAQRFIVRFKVQPKVEANSAGRLAQSQSIEGIHEQFLHDLQLIEGYNSSGRVAGEANTIVHFHYKKTLNAVAITTSSATKQEIEKLDYVQDVVEDKVVEAFDNISNDQINAPKVWSNLGATGKNIRMGIIDTGIDYLHEDLGGGIGQSFKVKGGYDFVNEDTDPMDDHGHGTHVAGIAAANGPGLKGVAPDANLYAYKVLDKWGFGRHSLILAAIERSVDPDQDPSTDDALDVVNMSLGGPVEDDDLLSEAVNNAVLQGVVCVIASGNNSHYQTVGSPGIAEKAITVGATDQNDLTAEFSSKGPTADTYLIKPDVSAPGVKVYSSLPGNLYEKLNGTSMAAPHVSGAVALLLEKNPSWSPDIVKSALMNTAKRSNDEPLWHQGAGRIDVYDAIQSQFVISPGSISLGLSNFQQSDQQKTQQITLYNLSESELSFNLQAEGEGINSQIQVVISPTELVIPPKDSAKVDITFNFNASSLPSKSFPECYSGNIIATAGTTSITAPFALLHSRMTQVAFTGELPKSLAVAGITDPSYFRVFTPKPDLKLLLPDGTYDIAARYESNYIVIKENVNSAQEGLTFDKSQADNEIVFKPLDEEGNPLSLNNASGSTVLTGLEGNLNVLWLSVEDTIYLSDNTRYKIKMNAALPSGNDPSIYYDVTISSPGGIMESAVYSNNSSDFTKLIVVNPSVNQGDLQDMIYYSQVQSLTVSNSDPVSVTNPFTIYHSQNDPSTESEGSYVHLKPQDGHGYEWETASWNVFEDQSIVFADTYQKSQVTIDNTTEFTYNLGETLPRLFAQTVNHENKIVLTDHPAHGVIIRHLGEHEDGTVKYQLRNEIDTLQSGITSNRLQDDISSSKFILELEEEQGPYTLELKYNDYAVAGTFGEIEAVLQFNTSLDDKNPPGISSFYLEVDGESVNTYPLGQNAKIRLKVEDKCEDNTLEISCSDSGIKSVSLFFKKQDAEVWEELSAVVEQGENVYSIPDALEQGYYSVKIVSVDLSDNSLTYQVHPAFLVGEASEIVPYKAVKLAEPVAGNLTGLRPHFSWSEITEASSYHMQVAYDEAFTDLAIDSVLQDTVSYSPIKDLDEQTPYYWRVKAHYESGESRWSETENFLTTNENWDKVVTLVSPIDGDLTSRSPHFLWTPVEDAISYVLQASSFNDFDILAIDTVLETNEYMAEVPLELQVYYKWRVKPIYSQDEGRWSAVSGFSVAYERPVIVDLISPQNFEVYTSPVVSLSWETTNAEYYFLEISGDSLFTENFAYSNLTNSNTIDIPLKLDKKYYWRVKPDLLEGEWSEVYQFSTTLTLEAISPLDQSKDQPVNPYFSWRNIQNIDSYIFQLSENPEFISFVEDTIISNPNISFSPLRTLADYYWHFGIDFDGERYWSDTYNFRTGVVTGMENEDGKMFIRSYPNPFSDKMNVEIYSPLNGDALLTITNLLGNVVYRQHIVLEGQTKQIVWDGTNASGKAVSDGVYIGKVETSSKSKSFKIILKRN